MLEGRPRRLLFVASLLLASQASLAFTVVNPRLETAAARRSIIISTSSSLFQSSSDNNADDDEKSSSLIVISPPGGVGEVTAVKAATMGAAVRWFVVSPNSNSKMQVVLSQQALDEISAAGGKVELAGADAPSLLLSKDDAQSAVQAVSAWCGAADSIVCTFDGTSAKQVEMEITDEGENPLTVWKDAIKVAAQQASTSVRGKKLAILSLEEGLQVDSEQDEDGEFGAGGLGSLVGGLLGGGGGAGSKMQVPATLVSAMTGDTSNNSNLVTLRHGNLFGTPESSPDFSALTGGPRRAPELCEEYATRTVRVDPSLSLAGNYAMMGDATRSSRHAVGEAAALFALNKIPTPAATAAGLDISVSSQRGTDPPTLNTWLKEMERVNEALSSGSAGAQLFSADFGSVPDISRLTGWLATKWAPTVLRTYDIAAIRKGARPVYANQVADDELEIVWQELVDFQTVTAGRMLIQVSDKGLVALRGPGDASKAGFGEISRKPLQGEDVLVRRLAEAASQAIEKGLANKSKVQIEQARKPKKAPVVKPEPAVVSSLQSSGTVDAAAAATAVETPSSSSSSSSSSSTGPRKAGARRSRERARGKKRKSTPPSSPPAASSSE